MTAQQVGAMLASGELKASESLAWRQGMDDWQRLADSGVLAEASLASTGGAPAAIPRPSLSPAPASVAQPNPQAAMNPYTAPVAANTITPDYAQPLEYPGIGRLAYVGLQIGMTIAAYIMLFVVVIGAGALDSGGGAFAGLMLVMVLAAVAGIYIGVKRVQNLGMSGWAILWSLVPIMSVWISWRMFACPAGYDDHKQLDTAGKVLTGILIGLIALGVLVNFIAVFGVSQSS